MADLCKLTEEALKDFHGQDNFATEVEVVAHTKETACRVAPERCRSETTFASGGFCRQTCFSLLFFFFD